MKIPNRVMARRWAAQRFYRWAARLDYQTVNPGRRFVQGKKCSLECGRDADCLHQFWAHAAPAAQTKPGVVDISVAQGSTRIQTPLCGQCFDMIRFNFRLGATSGYDFRPRYRCTHKWHKTGYQERKGSSFLKRGMRLIDVQAVRQGDQEGLLSMWGCPNPRCQSATVTEMPEEQSPEAVAAAQVLFGGIRDVAAKYADRAGGFGE